MDDQTIGAALRVIRIRKRLRQSDVARLAGVSRRSVGELERGAVGATEVAVLRAVAVALEARVEIDVRWGGADLDRLLAAATRRSTSSSAGTSGRCPAGSSRRRSPSRSTASAA